MSGEMRFYANGTGATQSESAVPARALQHEFAWMTRPQRTEPEIPPRLAAEIREALAAVERGEIEDLGDFSQYVDDDED